MGRIPAIDGLRAIAVLSVLLFHARASALPGGYSGVDIFFVISGFVVTGSLSGKRFDSLFEMIVYFYARRLMRIMPALAIMLLTTIVFADLFIPDAWLSRSINGTGKAAFLGASNIYLSLKSENYFSPGVAFNPYLHTWSLGVEEQFYVIFPFLMFWHMRASDVTSARRRFRMILALTVASFIGCGVLSQIDWLQSFYSIVARFWELGIGMLLCLSMGSWQPKIAAWEPPAARMVAGGAMVLMGIAFLIPESRLFPFPLAVVPVFATAIVIMLVCARPTGTVSAFLSKPVAVGIGKISYSLYLWHWPIFVLFRWTVGLASLGLIAAATAITFALATLSYFLVERTVHRSDRLKALRRGTVVALGLGLVVGSAAAGRTLIAKKPSFDLSVTANWQRWYADERHQLTSGRVHCQMRWQGDERAGGTVTSWIPTVCDIPKPRGRLFSVGDSHNLAYGPMLRQTVASEGMEIHSFWKSGCPFLDLRQPMGRNPDCSSYIEATIAYLKTNLRPEDIVFLPSLRLDRLSDQMASPAGPATTPGDRSAAFVEAQAVARALTNTGARIVFEAPPPLFPSPAFRCSDWLNRANPICAGGLSIPTARLEELRRPVLAAMAAIEAGNPLVTVWDPFPILCGTAICAAVTSKGPLFFDGDHVTGYANDLLYPSFRDALVSHLPGVTKPAEPMRAHREW